MTCTEWDASYVVRLRTSMRGAIDFARRRQAKKARPAAVNLKLDEAMAILRKQDYRCALTGLPFWSDEADRFGPSLPTLDRIDPNGPYSTRNVRVVFLGVNSLRGRSTDDDMYRIARALIANRPHCAAAKAAVTRAMRRAANPKITRATFASAAANALATRRALVPA